MRICYCEDCGLRVSESDIASGAAVQRGTDSYRCAACGAAKAPPKPPGKTTMARAVPVSLAPASPGATPSKPRAKAVSVKADASRNQKWIMLGGGALAVLGLLLILLAAGHKPRAAPSPADALPAPPAPPPEKKETVAAPTPPPKPAEQPTGGLLSTLRPDDGDNPREGLAARELQEIKRFAKEHPDDSWEYADMLADFLSRRRTTNAGKEAERLAAGLKPPTGKRLDHPAAHWKFDDGAGTAAQDSAGVSPGTLKGQTSRVAGKVGSGAVSLSGNPDDYVDLGAAPALNFAAGQPFTIAGWVKTSAQFGTIVSWRHSTQDGPVIDIAVGNDGAADSPGCLMALVRQNGADMAHARVTGPAVNDGAWHHFALARNRDGSICLFMDGVTQGVHPGANSSGSIPTDLRAVGVERAWVQDNIANKTQRSQDRCCLKGEVDDLRVYKYALSEAEARELAGAK